MILHPAKKLQDLWEPLLLIGILAAMLIVRLDEMPALVSGNDPGNWLAQAGQLAGVRTTAAFTAYPPLLPLTLLEVESFFPPLAALRLTAAVVSLLPGLTTYLLLRSVGLRITALPGLAMSFSGYSSEMLAWGAYPQLLGTGLAIGAIASLVHGVRSNDKRFWVVAGMLSGMTILANQLSGLQVIGAVALTFILAAFREQIGWKGFVTGGGIITLGAVVTSLPAAAIYLALLKHTGSSAFNASDFSNLGAQVGYVIEEGPLLWAAVFATVPAAITILGRQRPWGGLGALLALLAVSVGPILITHEVRFLHLAEAAGLLAFGTVLGELTESHDGWRPLNLFTAAIAAVLVLSLAWLGGERYTRAYAYYDMLDQHVAEGLQWLRQDSRPGDVAASAASIRNWPMGWWVEGLAQIPTYVETDSRWVAFDGEKKGANIARTIFSNPDPQAAAAEAQRDGVTLLVIDTRDNGRANQWIQSGRVTGPIGVVYSNPSLVIFRVATPGS